MGAYIEYMKSLENYVKDQRGLNAELLQTLPEYVKLIIDLLNDKKLSRDEKLYLNAALGYLLNPEDVIPDNDRGMGYLDDLFVCAWAVNYVFRYSKINKNEYWSSYFEGDSTESKERVKEIERLMGKYKKEILSKVGLLK